MSKLIISLVGNNQQDTPFFCLPHTPEMTISLIKPVSESGGVGCSLLTLDNFEEEIDLVLTSSKIYDLIVEERVKQHSIMDEIYPYSVNTLRVITFNIESVVEVYSSFARFGRGGGVVDNGSSGGVFVHFDLHKNQMGTEAFTLASRGGQSFFRHPDTGFEFANARLPYTDEIIALAKKGAKHLDVAVVGWDIAITQSGPIIIEANTNPSLLMTQIAYNGIFNHPIYSKFLASN